MTAADNPGVNTRHTILLTAMRLYAEKGLQGVSLRSISSQSGTRNSAAAHYHFGNRLGVIEGVITFILDYLRPAFEKGIDQVERQPAPSLRDVVQAVFSPYLALSVQPEWGRWALRFMAHLHTDNSPEIAAILNRHFRLDMERIEALLHRVRPDIPRDLLRIRLAFCLVNVVHGSAEVDLLVDTPFGNIRPDDMTLYNAFLDFLEGGLGKPCPPAV